MSAATVNVEKVNAALAALTARPDLELVHFDRAQWVVYNEAEYDGERLNIQEKPLDALLDWYECLEEAVA